MFKYLISQFKRHYKLFKLRFAQSTVAIAVIGGGLKKQNGKWHTTTFNEMGDKYGSLGDRLRVIAASYLHYENPDYLVITLGGKGQLKNIPDAPPVSQVLKDELIERNVPEKNIIIETESGNTFEQLQQLKKIYKEKNLKKTILVSNYYHLPRTEAMIKQDKELNAMLNNNEIILQSAEEILLERKLPKWKKIILSAYGDGIMQKRISMEQKGVKDIQEGKYKFN